MFTFLQKDNFSITTKEHSSLWEIAIDFTIYKLC